MSPHVKIHVPTCNYYTCTCIMIHVHVHNDHLCYKLSLLYYMYCPSYMYELEAVFVFLPRRSSFISFLFFAPSCASLWSMAVVLAWASLSPVELTHPISSLWVRKTAKMSVWFKKSFLDWSEILLLPLLFFCVRVLYLASAGASLLRAWL